MKAALATAAAIAAAAFAAPAGAIVLLPKSQAQIDSSESRARALNASPAFPVLEALRNIEALLADPSSPLGRGVGDAVFEAARDRGFFLVIYPGFFYLEKFIALLP